MPRDHHDQDLYRKLAEGMKIGVPTITLILQCSAARCTCPSGTTSAPTRPCRRRGCRRTPCTRSLSSPWMRTRRSWMSLEEPSSNGLGGSTRPGFSLFTPNLFSNYLSNRYYQLSFHKKHRDLVIKEYLSHVVNEGKQIMTKNRQRKLYTNNGQTWNHVVFKHPARFETLGMDPEKKQEIIDDLVTFSKSKEFYADIGRAWKRGYLLYGPPGTGKSTMIAAMANLLKYDLYDLELTAVKDNTELKKLLIDTSSKSIILIEDIDCSIDLTGQRKNGKEEAAEEEKPKSSKMKGESHVKTSMVTLSGLLNFIDGLWSSCKGERLIVFTTNHVEKLDPALVRSGRMDKHIELSYCRFHAFKVLAKNYLKLEWHELFTRIGRLLEETDIAPADVAEHLMPKTFPANAEVCLQSLISALEMSKEKATMKSKSKSPEEEVKKESSAEEEPVDQRKPEKETSES